MRPYLPDVTRKAIRFSPSRRMRIGALSASGSSLGTNAGSQYSRMNWPIGVPGPTLHSSSLSSVDSIPAPLFRGFRMFQSWLFVLDTLHVGLGVVLREDGLAPVARNVSEDRVNVVGTILGVVVLDQEARTLDRVVVALAGLF